MVKKHLVHRIQRPATNAIVGIASLTFVYLAYNYANSLATCDCVDRKAASNIALIELALLVFVAIGVLGMFVPAFLDVSAFLKKHLYAVTGFGVMYILLLLSVIIVFVKNVHTFSKSYTSKCKCAMRWPRWIIYFQYAGYLLELSLVALLLVLSVAAALTGRVAGKL